MSATSTTVPTTAVGSTAPTGRSGSAAPDPGRADSGSGAARRPAPRRPIRIAIAGVGNCASSLLQGLEHYRRVPPEQHEAWGLMHLEMGGYRPGDVEVVAAFDVDARKVGRPLHEAAFAPPNCTTAIGHHVAKSEVLVQMGPLHDGVAPHMADWPAERSFRVADERAVDVAAVLRESGAEMLVSYLPVGSQKATQAYAEACLSTGVSLVNCIPAFIVSDPQWGERFRQAGIPCAGDDIKSQLGATILHRTLVRLFADRGVKIERTYQLNTGGNTDFLNMLSRERLASKKVSKTEAVTSQIPYDIGADNVHIGPSDYVPWQGDNKVCFLRIEARAFGGAPIELEARLSVQDSPNSAGIVIDVIRYVKLARERGLAGPLLPISAYTMKHPPVQMRDVDAARQIEAFLQEAEAGSNP
jgi:myo-inositol-1-phosphate synthase